MLFRSSYWMASSSEIVLVVVDLASPAIASGGGWTMGDILKSHGGPCPPSFGVVL